MKMFTRYLIVCMVFLLVGTAVAQVRSALVKNVDEPGRIPYQQVVSFNGSDTTNCAFGSGCVIPFPAVPAGKRLVVESVSMLVALVNGAQPQLFAFGDLYASNVGNIAIISPTFVNTGFSVLGSTFWAIDRPVRVYYEPGTVPKLKFFASGNITLPSSATIVGYLIDASN